MLCFSTKNTGSFSTNALLDYFKLTTVSCIKQLNYGLETTNIVIISDHKSRVFVI